MHDVVVYNYTIKILQLQQPEKGRNILDFWYFNCKIIHNVNVHFVDFSYILLK